MKKILFLNHNTVNYGTYYRCYFLGRELSNLGYDITILTVTDRKFSVFSEVTKINDKFKIIKLPRSTFYKYYTGHLRRIIINSIKILKERFDLIHSFAVAQPTTAIPSIISRIVRPNTPIMIDWDDAWGEGFGSYHPTIISRAIGFLERKTPKMCRAKRITMVSEYLKRYAMKIGYSEDVLEIIPNGSDVLNVDRISKDDARGVLHLPLNKNIVVSLGHTYMDSLNILFSAFEKVIDKNPETLLIMVGQLRIDTDIIHQKAKRIYEKHKQNIILTGEKDFKTAVKYLFASDILALPMEDSPVEKARFPIRLGDYLASGRPIVSNAVGEVKRILEEEGCGFTCYPSDVNGLSEAIVKLIEDKDIAEKYGEKARRISEDKYSWDKIAGRLNDIYCEVIDESSSCKSSV